MQDRLFPASPAPVDHAERACHLGIVRESSLREREFLDGRLVVTKCVVMIESERKMPLSHLRPDAKRGVRGPFCHGKAFRTLIVTEPIKLRMDPRLEAISQCKLRIARHRLFDQGESFLAIFLRIADPAPVEKFAGADIKVV